MLPNTCGQRFIARLTRPGDNCRTTCGFDAVRSKHAPSGWAWKRARTRTKTSSDLQRWLCCNRALPDPPRSRPICTPSPTESEAAVVLLYWHLQRSKSRTPALCQQAAGNEGQTGQGAKQWHDTWDMEIVRVNRLRRRPTLDNKQREISQSEDR